MKGAKVAALLVALFLSHGAFAQERHFDLSTMDAVHGIPEFARQAGIQIVAPADDLWGISTPAIRGNFDVRLALKKLLVGTDLEIASDDGAVITLRRRPKATKQSGNPNGSDTQRLTNETGAEAARNSPELTGSRSLEEIIVTAQKKSERLQDVPVPVTVVDTEALANNGAGRIQDYYATVPGLSLVSTVSGGGTQYLTLRGLSTTSGAGPTVAMVIDDVPFGLSTGLNLGQFGYPDIDPSDLARVEVLKGPQGTLYGADSLGGLVKVVTQDPSTAALSGHVQILGEDVSHGDAGYGVRGAVNIPISDGLAVRASAFYRRDPGFIDNVTTGEDNINSANVYGARLGALWQFSDAVSLKLGALFQNTQGFGVSQINTNSQFQPILGDLQQTGLPGTGRYSAQIQLYTATLNAKLGGLNFVSVSGYGINKWSNSLDFSALAPYDTTPFFGVAGDIYTQSSNVNQFSQEFRLSSSIGNSVDWLAGAFYAHERSSLPQVENGASAETGALVGAAYVYAQELTFHEYAVFGDLTFHVTDRFDIQTGGRGSWYHQIYNETDSGAGQVPPFVYPTLRANGTAFTYLVTPEFKISPDHMVYARIASGYRVGGPNLNVQYPEVPRSYRPDTTTNYDLGYKSNLFNHKLTIDASAYYIDWKDIQLGIHGPTCGGCYYQINGASAKSEGLELSLEARPFQGTTLRANGSFDNAVLTQNLPPNAAGAYGLAGDRLPYSARTSGSLGFEQDLFHFANATGFVGGDATYIGARDWQFPRRATLPQLQFPGYTTVNLHSGVRYDQWLFNLFANNVADRRGIIGGGLTYAIGNPQTCYAGEGCYATVIQPRTIGLSVNKDF